MPLFWGSSKALPRTEDRCLKSKTHFRNTFWRGRPPWFLPCATFPSSQGADRPATRPGKERWMNPRFPLRGGAWLTVPVLTKRLVVSKANTAREAFQQTINNLLAATVHPMTHSSLRVFFSLCPLPSPVYSQRGQSWGKPATHNLTFPPKQSLEESLEAWTASCLVFIASQHLSDNAARNIQKGLNVLLGFYHVSQCLLDNAASNFP